MRGLVSGLGSPAPLGPLLPAVYQEHDAFTMALSTAFDDVIAPIFVSLDNLPAYFDAALAPDDFVDWLATWVAVDFDESWDVGRRRLALSRGVDLHARRGTPSGLSDQVAFFTGGRVEIVENGASGWSLDASAPLPGSADAALVVRVRVEDPESVDLARLDVLVASAKPAHVPHAVEVVQLTRPKDAGKDRPSVSTPGETPLEIQTHERVPPDAAGAVSTDEPTARSPHDPEGDDEDPEADPML